MITTHRPHAVADVEHVFGFTPAARTATRRVVVGADRLGIRVDHDHLDHFVQRKLPAAVVESHPLPDAVRPATQDHNSRPLSRRRLVFGSICRIVEKASRPRTACRTCPPVRHRPDPPAAAVPPHFGFRRVPERRELPVGIAVLFRFVEQRRPGIVGASSAGAAVLQEKPAPRCWPGTRDRSRCSAIWSTESRDSCRSIHKTRSGLGVARLLVIS